MSSQLPLIHSLWPYRNRNLFSDYYLEYVLASTQGLTEWMAPAAMYDCLSTLQTLWERNRDRLTEELNESQT